jgi:DNA-binding CsgD family transcriptional regulator
MPPGLSHPKRIEYETAEADREVTDFAFNSCKRVEAALKRVPALRTEIEKLEIQLRREEQQVLRMKPAKPGPARKGARKPASGKKDPNQLTAKQKEIADLICDRGKSRADVADHLDVDESVVRGQLAAIRRKLKAKGAPIPDALLPKKNIKGRHGIRNLPHDARAQVNIPDPRSPMAPRTIKPG